MVRGRFAPSPTGRMHLGNVFSALLSWLSAKSQGGEWVLRIEDIDPQRSRQEYADQLMADLEWLGLYWDGTPIYQSQRSEIYREYLEVLQRKGMVYADYRTRADLLATQAPHESDGRVVVHRPEVSLQTMQAKEQAVTLEQAPFNEREITQAALRLEVPHETVTFIDGHYGEATVDLWDHVGDFIIRRKDGAYAYQLAVVVDDALTGVTEIVRGRDLLLSTAQQNWVHGLLFPGQEPIATYHFPLLINEAGQRLSKRDKSLDMGVLRTQYSASEIIAMLARYAGITVPEGENITPEALIRNFEWSRVPKEDIVVPIVMPTNKTTK